ncbi:mycofactocin-coupled SDR family oxidoreductase [Amycolatopsis acidicola]|uniref:Mycofactocin-coupled SDR family oxidoreductase n=1 Tax=Amycolatopsis acidicola TaxID=2596893 RepID=A0A5N0VCE3_9PSEU|nr:mycofactocin-coupled SDR family oxidoreductase [Amycolatopsis acidicola]KAA9164049.1 mycofactocin-coupled SDR family oxidoreductase [Amycolatopsis acidicola]
MPGRVEGKVAFITGAARGQGRSHALRLAEEGADVIAVDICSPVATVGYPGATPDDLDETAKLVQKLGRRVVAVQADVREQGALDDAVRRGVAELGRLDIVCANAGILTMALTHEQSEEQWQTMLDVNLTGVWHTVKAAIPVLIDQGHGGSIIITSSMAGLKGTPNCSSYTAAKFGVVGLAKTLAHELAPHRIRVNTVHPTNVETTMVDNALVRSIFRPDLEQPTAEDAKDVYASINIWPEPWIQPVDVSNAVLYLASDEARYTTGIALPVDLGATAK